MFQLVLLLAVAWLGTAVACPAQSRLHRNPLPKDYRGNHPTAPAATPAPVMRVGLLLVDASGQPLARAMVRVDGSAQALWTDEQGRLTLLVDLSRGPLHLTASAFGYEDAVRSITRPEDNNLVFQLFPSPPTKAGPESRP